MEKYDNFFLGVDNLEDSKKQYGDILGLNLKFDFSNNGMIAYNIGKEEPAIILKDKKYFENMKPTIWFVVVNVREEYKKMKGRGISFLSEPFEIKTGFAVEFEDPFGNRLGITDYCKKEFQEENSNGKI